MSPPGTRPNPPSHCRSLATTVELMDNLNERQTRQTERNK
uniref:Uncharacterized protein n=1 Tax=Anguilla anguilla TaxID=7936 RepID=A0A0E9U3Q2_ANGAN